MKSSTHLTEQRSKDIFENIKSKYILLKIFENMPKRKSLDIIRYNKTIKKRININVKDYEECSLIEIEIIPFKNKYGLFINIKKEQEKYYHIYFDNNKEEIKRNYLKENEQVKIIRIIIDYQVKSFEDLFDSCGCVESIYFKKFYRNNINNMRFMFLGCLLLKEINLSNFNTNNVTNMGDMFSRCSSLKRLNISNFNTNNVTNMRFMFHECSSLEELNISNFNTNNVTDMSYMFSGCSSLKELNISNLNINNPTNINGMFSKCSYKLKMKIKSQYNNIKEEVFV